MAKGQMFSRMYWGLRKEGKSHEEASKQVKEAMQKVIKKDVTDTKPKAKTERKKIAKAIEKDVENLIPMKETAKEIMKDEPKAQEKPWWEF